MKPIKYGTITTVVKYLKDEGRLPLAQLVQDLWYNWQEKERLLAREKRDSGDLVKQLAEERGKCEALRDVLEVVKDGRDALAAHVESLKEFARNEPEVDDLLDRLDKWCLEAPAISLARLKAEWQVEALEKLHLEDCATLQDVLERKHNAINELRHHSRGKEG